MITAYRLTRQAYSPLLPNRPSACNRAPGCYEPGTLHAYLSREAVYNDHARWHFGSHLWQLRLRRGDVSCLGTGSEPWERLAEVRWLTVASPDDLLRVQLACSEIVFRPEDVAEYVYLGKLPGDVCPEDSLQY